MDQVLATISELYGLKLALFEKVEKGFLSENHVLVEVGGSDESATPRKFFLKKYRFKNVDRLIEIHAVKEYFAHGGIPVILPFPLLDGQTFFNIDDSFYALFPFVDEKEGRQYERLSLPKPAIASMGKMLAKIHLLGKESKLPINDFMKSYDTPKRIGMIDNLLRIIDGREKNSQLDDFDVRAREGLLFKKNMLTEFPDMITISAMPNDHLLHGDFQDSNVFFGKDDEVSHVFDFEKTGYGPRISEVFRCMMYSFVYKPFPDDHIYNARLFLDSYRSVYPMSREEAAIGLRMFFNHAVHGTWIADEHYLKHSNRVDSFLNNDVERLEFFQKNFAELEKRIIGE